MRLEHQAPLLSVSPVKGEGVRIYGDSAPIFLFSPFTHDVRGIGADYGTCPLCTCDVRAYAR